MGPFYLTDLLGLDTVLHVAEHLQESYGDRFYVHPKMKELVEAGNLGQKSGKGFYEHAEELEMEGHRTADDDRRALRAEGVRRGLPACSRRASSTAKDIELGMMMGAGHPARARSPAPTRRASTTMLAALERAQSGVGRGLRAAAVLRAPGRPGAAGAQERPGLLPLPAARRRASSRRRCCSRRAATWRSCGSTARPPTRSRPQLIRTSPRCGTRIERDEIRVGGDRLLERLRVLAPARTSRSSRR